ncbi:MAG: TAT-variant-translocated molybdopterin oxidoreductase [Candidatus Zixiibacteriota bacterium]
MESKGKDYWRSLDQLAQTDEFKEFLYREFPRGTVELADNAWTRRSFLTTMGASLALAGLTSCRRPVEKIVPYVTRPEQIDPGVPNYYATTMPFGLSAIGVVVTTYEGRPTFIQGNELHPSSRGAVNPIVQASILDLYDPDRSKSVLRDGSPASWADFVAWWKEQHARFLQGGGEGLAVLSETFSSPTLARLKRQFHETFPKAKWVAWEPISDENIYKGIELATGQVLQPVYDFANAKVVLALDCDFLGTESDAIANTAGFSEARGVFSQQDEMNRLYAVEPSLTITGMMADHRVRSSGGDVVRFLAALAAEVNRRGTSAGFIPETADHSFDAILLRVLADDLLANRGRSLVIAGRRQPPAVHHIVMALNQALGNIGTTVAFHPSPDMVIADTAGLGALVADMNIGKVQALVMLGGNPVYHAPRTLEFEAALSKVPARVHLATHVDETSTNVSWHLPRANYLESWGDARAADGTVSVVQPTIRPLHGAHGDIEFAGLLVTAEEKSAHELVREVWRQRFLSGDFEANWRRVLHDGVFHPKDAGPVRPSVSPVQLSLETSHSDDMEVSFNCGAVFDGRCANNAWLQELPDPATKLTWGNAALISPKLADALGLKSEDMVELDMGGRSIEIPAWISPGQVDNSISVALGYGRTAAGQVGDGVGVDVSPLRTSENMWFESGVKVRKTGRTIKMACTQDHGSMEGRPIVRENTLAGYKESGEFYPKEIEHPSLASMWNEHKYDEGYQWGMSIDLNACTGCNACVIACQSENNIPVVGREQVARAREMHWMRIDRYYAGDINDPEVAVQPMNCQHCEMAPCEQVCPVAATNHDTEGLNVMVYNRCIGTRYCSNNCPYKVRRFNFFNYTKDLPEVVQMAQNPEVTVRFRGVMEKCTYCIQRISVAKSNAKNQGRPVADGEIRTACQSACPARAIVFGNIADPDSEVSRLKKNNRKYRVLEELNVRPRTTYLAKLRNPHPSLASRREPTDEHGHG